MPADAEVAQLAGAGSIFDVSDAKLECVFISAFEHNDRETETRNLEKPYGRSHPSVSAGSGVVSGPTVPAGKVNA
jgi:hypothetical protein